MKEIVCFGDSNTYGLIPATLNRYDYEERWTGLLAKKLNDKGYHVSEEGLCGRTSVFDDPFRNGRKGTEILPTILETHAPIEIMIVMLGTNDCKTIYDASAETIGLGIEKIIEQIRNFDSKIKIMLISPIELGEDIWDGYDPEFDKKSVEVSKKLGEVYEKIALKQNVKFLRAADYASPSSEDREHLSKIGHSGLANAIHNKLQQFI